MVRQRKQEVAFDRNSQVRRSRRTKVFFVALVMLLVLAGGAVGFLRKADFQVRTVTVGGTKSLDPALVEKTLRAYLSGDYLAVIPRTNSLLVSKSGAERALTGAIPTIETARVSFVNRTSLHVAVTEKKPLFLWCRDDDCYFVDRAGVIYEEAPRFGGGIFVTFSGGTLPVGKDPLRARFVSASDFASASAMLSSLAAYPVHVLGVEYAPASPVVAPEAPGDQGALDDTASGTSADASSDGTSSDTSASSNPPSSSSQSDGDISFRVDQIGSAIVDPQARILVTKDTSADAITDSLGLLLADHPFADLLSTKGGLLQYVDLRFPGKIYYKFSK